MVNYKLHLIRHGMTESNRDGRYAGRADVLLCQEGKTELSALKNRFGYPQVAEVYCSPLRRCRQTADILYPDAPMTLVDGLVEISMGDFEGRLLKDLKDEPAYREWLADSLHNPPPGSLETGEEFASRIAQALHSIFADMTRRKIYESAVVTHGGVIMGLLSSFAMPRRPLHEWAVGNGQGYTLSMSTQLWMRDGIVEVTSSVPLGTRAGSDEKVMRSLGLKDGIV